MTAGATAARKHSGGLGIKPTNVFTNAEGTKPGWEYIHTGEYFDLLTLTEPETPSQRYVAWKEEWD
jgi:hypothetical protein